MIEVDNSKLMKFLSLFVNVMICAVWPFLLNSQQSETIFDRNVQLYDEILEIPVVSRWEQELGIKGQHILAGDINLWVEQIGQGEPLILISGGPGTGHHYFHPYFQKAGDFSEVIFYDQRGVGLSDYQRDSAYLVEQAADDLENLRAALGYEKWTMLGLSFGAAIAEFYTIKYPERVSGLVFVGAFTPTVEDLGIGTRQRDYQSPEEINTISSIYNIGGRRTPPAHSELVTPELQAQMAYNAFMNGDWKRRHLKKIPELEIARYVRYEWVHDMNYYSEMLQDGLGLDFTNHFIDCPIPILIFEGKWDLAYGELKHKTMQSLFPNAKIVFLENSGHIPFEDEPEIFFNHLEKFILSLPQVSNKSIFSWSQKISKMSIRK